MKYYFTLVLAFLFNFTFIGIVWADELRMEYQTEHGFEFVETSNREYGDLQLVVAPYLSWVQGSLPKLGLSEAYLEWDASEWLQFSLGRKIITYGPGRYGFPALGPLVSVNNSDLSFETVEGYDQFGYSFNWRNLNYHKFYALVTEDFFRVLHGHRLTYTWGGVTFGISETALTNDSAPWFYYLPLPMYLHQFVAGRLLKIPEANVFANVAIDLDLTWQMRPNFKVYAEYYMDDRPWPHFDQNWHLVNPQWDRCWWKCGYQGGFAWEEAFGVPDLNFYAEYTRIDQYTYTSWHPGAWRPGLDWTYRGRMIGEAMGPDSDRLNLELTWQPNPEWQYSFAYLKKRHGEGEIGDRWEYVPGQTVVFLTGNVETTDQLLIGASKMKQAFQWGGKIGIAYCNNVAHQIGQNSWQLQLSLYSSYHF